MSVFCELEGCNERAERTVDHPGRLWQDETDLCAAHAASAEELPEELGDREEPGAAAEVAQ